MEEDKIMEKIKKFLEKEGYEETNMYFLFKKMEEELWENIRDGEIEEEDEFEEEKDELSDEEVDKDLEEPLTAKKVNRLDVKKELITRPRLKPKEMPKDL